MKSKKYVIARDADQAQHRAENSIGTFGTKKEAIKAAKESNAFELDHHRSPIRVYLARTVVEAV